MVDVVEVTAPYTPALQSLPLEDDE